MNPVALVLLAIIVAAVAFAAGRRRTAPAERPEPSEHEQLASTPGVWITDAGGSCTWLSEIHPDDIPRCMPVLESSFEKRQPVEIEYRQRQHDGELRWMHSCGVPRFDRDGNFCGYIGVTLDISARKRAEDAPRIAAKASKKKVVDNEPKSIYPDLRLKQILVVDREAATLDFTAELLRQCGARVTIARSAAEAILALHQHHDLVVTDNAVPVTEGVMLAQQLRQANGGLPAIVLRKPIDGAELASEIAQLFTRSGEA